MCHSNHKFADRKTIFSPLGGYLIPNYSRIYDIFEPVPDVKKPYRCSDSKIKHKCGMIYVVDICCFVCVVGGVFRFGIIFIAQKRR